MIDGRAAPVAHRSHANESASRRRAGAAAELLCLASYLKSVRLRRTRVQSGDRNGCERRVSLRRAAPRAARAAFAPLLIQGGGRQLKEKTGYARVGRRGLPPAHRSAPAVKDKGRAPFATASGCKALAFEQLEAFC